MQNNQETQNALAQARELADKATALWHFTQRQGTGPIGLDFGHNSINAVQLRRRGSALQIVAADYIPYPVDRAEVLANPELLHPLIEQLLASAGFKGKEVVVSAPMGEPKVLLLSFKSGSPQDVPRQVMELVKERLGGADNDWLVDYLPVQLNLKNSQETTVMAAAMQRESSLNFMLSLQSAGLHLHALEIAPQALQRLLTTLEEQKPNCIVMNFGLNSTYISHFLHGRLTMDREIALGYEDFISPICASLSLDRKIGSSLFQAIGFGENTEITPLLTATFDRLKNQIDRMNQYIASQLHGDGIDCIYLAGEAANWPEASRAFSSVLGHETKVLNAFDLLDCKADVFVTESKRPMLSIATGLAMRWSV